MGGDRGEAAGGGGITVDETAVRRGLQAVPWEGRLEVLERGPDLVLDGAHNPAAALVLAEYLTEWRASRPEARVILVLGMMRDKDHVRFVEPLYRLVSEAVLTEADMAGEGDPDIASPKDLALMQVNLFGFMQDCLIRSFPQA